MSHKIKAVCIAGAVLLATSLAPAYGQTVNNQGGPTTRAEQKQDLKTLEKNGYNPAKSDNTTYPKDLQAAEQKAHGGQSANAGMPANSHVVTSNAPPLGPTGQPASAGNH